MTPTDASASPTALTPGPPEPTIKTLPISEAFGPTIQGEGPNIGTPTVFVRFGGCDYRCSWCDTPYAVLPKFARKWRPWAIPEIVYRVKVLASDRPMTVTLSGGNPALYDLGDLIDELNVHGFRCDLETQGSRAQQWMAKLDHLILSPKPPSSGMSSPDRSLNDPAIKKLLVSLLQSITFGPWDKTFLKFVYANTGDIRWAEWLTEYLPRVPVYLQPCNITPGSPDPQDVARLVELGLDYLAQNDWQRVKIIPQVHTLLWGNAPGK